MDEPPTTIITLGKSAKAEGVSVLMRMAPMKRPIDESNATIVKIDKALISFYQIRFNYY